MLEKLRSRILDILWEMCSENIYNDTSPSKYFNELKELFEIYSELERAERVGDLDAASA